MDLRDHDPGFRSETFHTSSGDGNQITAIKIEEVISIKEDESPEAISFPQIKSEVISIKEEESPEAISFPGIKTEHEVSLMPVCPLFCTSYRY